MMIWRDTDDFRQIDSRGEIMMPRTHIIPERYDIEQEILLMQLKTNDTAKNKQTKCTKEGGQTQVDTMKLKSWKRKVFCGLLHLTTLVFNFYALASWCGSLLDFKGSHGDQDVDLFKQHYLILVVVTGIAVSPVAMRIVNKTYEDTPTAQTLLKLKWKFLKFEVSLQYDSIQFGVSFAIHLYDGRNQSG